MRGEAAFLAFNFKNQSGIWFGESFASFYSDEVYAAAEPFRRGIDDQVFFYNGLTTIRTVSANRNTRAYFGRVMPGSRRVRIFFGRP
jgi:hypothetical protein